MRAVVQRVTEARVVVAGEVVGSIDGGLLILLGVAPDDGPKQVLWLAEKCARLRIFEDDDGKMNRSLLDVGGAALVVSQFTLYGDCRRGRRPSFVGAARPELAEPLYESFVAALGNLGVGCVQTGRFAADMAVSLTNDGPVTLVVDTP
jgi:D-tyrosyl-tRNA(Tyr) deacylase